MSVSGSSVATLPKPRYNGSMVDTRSPEQRRRIMQSVKTRNTGPELTVRRALFVAGYRYRLHRKDLPGRPDIVLPGRKKVIFVHGCFWHGHGCAKGRGSKSRLDYWEPKLMANKERDTRNARALMDLGWGVLTLWQCQLSDAEQLKKRLQLFLGPSKFPIDKP